MDDETFLGLTNADLLEVGMKHEDERRKLLEEIDKINQELHEVALRAAAASSEEGAQHDDVAFDEFEEYTVGGGDAVAESVAAVTTAEVEDSDFVLY